ncbi:MAG: hypothetical protein K8R35_02560 [Bacteroidales bacterium]|nr:hypothetical protein [Bacteroidales bacterium]
MSPIKFKDNLTQKINGYKKRLVTREVAVFSFFLLLSFIFWFLNALSKDISGKTDYPVRYINFPEERVLVNELPDHLRLTLNGAGYSLLKKKLGGGKSPLVVDIEKVSKVVTGNNENYRFYLLTYGLRESFSRQIRADFEISYVNPDTIFFEFDHIVSKHLPVFVDIDVNTQKQFFVHGNIGCVPDSVEISGPRSMLDTIFNVRTKFFRFDQLSQTTVKNLALEVVPKTSLSDKKVEVTVPVEQYTEIVKEIPITILNEPDTAMIRLFPDRVSFQCIVALSDYNNMMDAPVHAVVDPGNIDFRVTNKLRVELLNLPDFASQVRYNPQVVEYLIERR